MMFVAVAVARRTIYKHKARALVHEVCVKFDMNAMLRLGAIATVRTWSTLGELKRGIDHPCFGMTRGTRGAQKRD
jgi:hypothetical protein